MVISPTSNINTDVFLSAWNDDVDCTERSGLYGTRGLPSKRDVKEFFLVGLLNAAMNGTYMMRPRMSVSRIDVSWN